MVVMQLYDHRILQLAISGLSVSVMSILHIILRPQYPSGQFWHDCSTKAKWLALLRPDVVSDRLPSSLYRTSDTIPYKSLSAKTKHDMSSYCQLVQNAHTSEHLVREATSTPPSARKDHSHFVLHFPDIAAYLRNCHAHEGNISRARSIVRVAYSDYFSILWRECKAYFKINSDP